MKDKRLVEELKARLDIADVISDYVELTRAGQNYKGLCPFHSEKTPSFMVSPDKQRFHCFGCGADGDVIGFVMKYENLAFLESLALLARKAGIDLKEYKLSVDDEGLREKMLEVHREASRFFSENLARSRAAFAYLKARGLAEETIRLFSLGYAIRDRYQLSNHLKDKGFPKSSILQSGVVSSSEKGIYDTFRDRIIFPICDVQGDIIAFGGRVMDDSQPKYLNSPESPLFKKGETLYGLNRAKDVIRKRRCAIIVEGYLDVMMSHQYGFDNTVAPLGTALTSGHVQKLKRYTKKAILVFDGDEAGRAAARRSLPILLEQGFVSRILLLPRKEDPDSFLRKNGSATYDGLLSEAKSVIDFILDASGADRTEAVHEAIGIISAAGDTIMKEELIGELAQRTGKSEPAIREELRRLSKSRGKRKGESSPHASLDHMVCYDEELLLLSAVIAFPEKLTSILHGVSVEEFKNPTVRSVMTKFAATEGNGFESLFSSLNEEEKALVLRLTYHPGFDREDVERNIADCMRVMEDRMFKEQGKQIHERIRQAEKKGDHELLYALLKERQRMMKEAR